MSDDISIPRPALSGNAPGRTSFTHSYRSRRAGMDAGTKMLLLAASALGAALLGGMAFWSFSGRHPAADVPRIEADSRPLRIKPDNPGGMTAIGVNDQPVVTGSGAGDLAPAAEQPDPQALLAQRRAAPAPMIAPATVPAAPASVPTAPITPPVVQPLAATQAPPPSASGGPIVQLAALDSESGATAEWQRLAHKLPDLLGSRRPLVQRTDQGGKAFWRLRTGGFADTAEATQFCQRVRAKGVSCSLANF